MATKTQKYINLTYSQVMPTQEKFLSALSRLEERTEDGKRRVDVEENFQANVVNEANELLKALMHHRLNVQIDLEKGRKEYPAHVLRQAFAEKCREDILYWFNETCWIRNPHLTRFKFPIMLPFVLFPKQAEYILWREDLYKKGRSGVVYKCREVGVSWMNVAVQAHHWLFEEGYQGRMGSLKAEEVDDKNDPDALLQKMRDIIYWQPKWMRPPEFLNRDNKFDNLMKIVNPTNGAVITGQQGESMGRGGRASMFDVDEWAKVQHAKAVDAALSMNCPCIIYTSTPMGRDNDFYSKVTSGKLPVFEFNYWDDPRKSKDWFENFSATHNEETVQQEVLKSFDAFRGGTMIPPEWVSAAVTLYSKIRSGEIEYKPDKKASGLDVAAGGRHSSAMVIRDGIIIESEYKWNIANSTSLVERATTVAEEEGVELMGFDPIGVGVGARSAFERIETAFRVVSVDSRGGASEVPLDGDTRPARDRCANRRAELAERARLRFERTFEFVAQKVDHPIDALVAISPSCQNTIIDLSIPERLMSGGKIRLESKESMAARGEPSPDFFDAFMISWADEVKDVHVVRNFNPKAQGVIEEEEIPAIAMSTMPNHRNYISVYHSKNYNAGAVGALWNGTQLLVYGELVVPNPSVRQMASCLRVQFPTKAVYEWVGNQEMFREGTDDLFMMYLQSGIMFMENSLYNTPAAVALLNDMFESAQIRIHKKCITLIRQLDSFVRHRGKPDEEGMEVALALCNLVNRIDEMNQIQVNPRGPSDYGRPIVDGKIVQQSRR